LEYFTRESKTKYSALLHFGSDPVTQDLPGWFSFYNHRQTIEAGIKESNMSLLTSDQGALAPSHWPSGILRRLRR